MKLYNAFYVWREVKLKTSIISFYKRRHSISSPLWNHILRMKVSSYLHHISHHSEDFHLPEMMLQVLKTGWACDPHLDSVLPCLFIYFNQYIKLQVSLWYFIHGFGWFFSSFPLLYLVSLFPSLPRLKPSISTAPPQFHFHNMCPLLLSIPFSLQSSFLSSNGPPSNFLAPMHAHFYINMNM